MTVTIHYEPAPKLDTWTVSVVAGKRSVVVGTVREHDIGLWPAKLAADFLRKTSAGWTTRRSAARFLLIQAQVAEEPRSPYTALQVAA